MLTAEQQKLAADNHNLIYDCLHRNGWDIDEYYDLAAIGLCKAAMAYDPSKGKFTALAYRAMSNEVKKTFELAACKKRTATLVSLDAPIEGTQATYGGLISKGPDPEDEAICSEIIDKILQMKPDIKEAVLLTYQGKSTKEIAKRQGCTHQYISRKLRTARAML